MNQNKKAKITILGIGNTLFTDEGVGTLLKKDYVKENAKFFWHFL
ncbi:hypothetical protein [Bacillus multifaciens]|nr:hypothetical protein [Bacillus sp. WLY-B-L8]MDP7980184.1 hypothetical protein [Bacillus sp. WLY-B-L8]